MIDRPDELARVGRSSDGAASVAARVYAGCLDRAAIDRAYRTATLILGSRADAEDATHDAALTAWRRLDDLRDIDRFDAWFGRILVNACRDRLRSRRRASVSLDAPAISVDRTVRSSQPDASDAVADRDVVASALRTLGTDHREVVVLRFYLDLTVDEIADRTGVKAGTVKSRLHHAVRHLRAAIDATATGRAIR